MDVYEKQVVANRLQQISPTYSPRSAYPLNEGCHKLGIGRTSIYAMAKAGQIKLIKIAGRTLVPHSEIERLTSIERAA